MHACERDTWRDRGGERDRAHTLAPDTKAAFVNI